jgi:hypothetical protein
MKEVSWIRCTIYILKRFPVFGMWTVMGVAGIVVAETI